MWQGIKNFYHLVVAHFWATYYGNPSSRLKLIGVTGTDGKTTTTTLIYEILKACGLKVSMLSTVHGFVAGTSYDTGFHVTSPDPKVIQKLLRQSVDAGDTHFVMEVTSHGIDQNRVAGMHFAVGVITNVTHEHLDYHKTYERYRDTKLRLFGMSDIRIVNGDQPDLLTGSTKTMITFGRTEQSDINLRNTKFVTKLPGEYNRLNSLAALAVAESLGLDMTAALRAVRQFRGIVGRMEVLSESPFRIIVDFAHTPNALQSVLETVRKTTRKNLIHVFGCAGLRDRSKRPLMGAVSSEYADIIILTEEDYRTENLDTIFLQIRSGMQKKRPVLTFPRRSDAIDEAFRKSGPGDTVIITGKGHEMSLARGVSEIPWNDSRYIRNKLHGTGDGEA